MEINWLQSNNNYKENTSDLLHLEYQIRSFLIAGIIKEAEHLTKYCHFICLNFDTELKKFTLSSNTPEPFFSLLCPKVAFFNQQLCPSSLGFFSGFTI
tara:strand:+ start:7335 stop:7628 length:294 start_codon:yes stop_codon:yes gene_type:complete